MALLHTNHPKLKGLHDRDLVPLALSRNSWYGFAADTAGFAVLNKLITQLRASYPN